MEPCGQDSFSTGLDPWLERIGNLRNVVRQELVARQLDGHVNDLVTRARHPLSVLDVGAGQGTQALRLAARGHRVTAVEPDARMRTAFESAAAALEDEQRERVTLLAGDLTTLASVTSPAAYDIVLCHGVLMYVSESRPAIAALASRVAPGGIVSVVARNAAALAWRPATRHDWVAALALLDELQGSREEGRDSFYLNEIGVRARADWPEDLMAVFEAEDLDLQGWYGVRTASDNVSVDTPTPPHDELEQLLSVEERLGATDPYRRLSTLFHLVGRASG